MKRLLFVATILAGPLLAMDGATAQPIEGIYVGAGGGANFLSDERVRSFTSGGTTFSVPAGSRIRFGTGYVAVGSVGWGFGNGVRIEAEGSYRQNNLSTGKEGEQKIGGMGNVLFDLDIGSPYVFPYFGAGAGYQSTHQRAFPGLSNSSSPGSFAYQAIAGFGFPIPGIVGLTATAEYRYLGLAGDRTYSSTFLGPAPTRIAQKVTEDNNHSLMVGLRYAFNVTPPARPAPTAAVPVRSDSRSYLVFFDWDKSDLSARARQIIAQAAQSSASNAITRIEVDGHADKSGTAGYNLGLSRRRADAVAAELVRDGVPRSVVTVMAFGDAHPLVPTAAGVREPQNRRVEIILK